MPALGKILDLKARMQQSIIGQEEVIDRLIIGLLADGNLLVEGLPGLAKTRAINMDNRMPRNLDNNANGRGPGSIAGSLAALCLIVIVAMSIFAASAGRAQTGQSSDEPRTESPIHVPAEVCAECHKEQHDAWQSSHHAWALKPAAGDTVLGDFENSTLEHDGGRLRFFRRGERFLVETDDRGGARAEHEIKYTVGVEPLQQYLVELDKGRLQALDTAWDTERQQWFHLYPGQRLNPGDGLHWSGPYKNWNARCAECHQTNFVKGYSPSAGSYQSRWDELTVSCASCHGPGEAHVKWASDAGQEASRDDQGYQDIGLSLDPGQGGAQREIAVCAPCHSRRSPLGPDSPPAGAEFADHYQLALLREGLYHADGQIDDEVYVYGSFLQSRMYASGVTCSNCHDAHSGELVADDTNGVCAQCHSPNGNPDFPTLRKAVYDEPAHHHHDAASDGAKCVSCHMPSKTYMQVDPRRDHSFRVPRPDLSAKIGTPNACTACHDERKAAWAMAQVRAWFPDGRTGTPHYGEILQEGRTRSGSQTAEKLIALALDRGKPAIVRASALDLFRRSITAPLLPRVIPLLDDEDDLVRAASVRLFQNAPTDARKDVAIRLLSDPRKTVRLDAAKLLIGVPLGSLPASGQAAARDAMAAYQRSLFARADFPETQMQIAGLAMALRDFRVAEQALATATRMDPQMADAWLLRARIQNALRRPDRARAILEEAARMVPDNPVVLLELGVLYSGRPLGERLASEAVRNPRGDFFPSHAAPPTGRQVPISGRLITWSAGHACAGSSATSVRKRPGPSKTCPFTFSLKVYCPAVGKTTLSNGMIS